MLSYCLKCRKNTESKNYGVVKTKNGRILLWMEECFYQNVRCVAVKNQNLSKSNKLAD